MIQVGTWVSYGGGARIGLAVGLLALVGVVAGAEIRLPLPARAPRPSRTALTVTLVAWGVAVVTWLVGLVIFVRQLAREDHVILAQARPPDRVFPVTFVASVALFVIVVRSRPPQDETRVPSAAIGVIGALALFEFPFDLIVVARVHSVPSNPAFYAALFFVPLFAIELLTLLLLSMSPLVSLTRATFFCFALMIAVFAVWALTGFGYPDTLVPLSLNIVSKLLAFGTAGTLFFPRRTVVTADITAPVSEAN